MVLQHLKKKKICESKYLNVSHDQVKEEFVKLQHLFVEALEEEKKTKKQRTQHEKKERICDLKELVCEFCGLNFTTSTSYYRHKKHFCKKKKQIDEILDPKTPKELVFVKNLGDENWNDITDEDLEKIFLHNNTRKFGNEVGDMFKLMHIDREENMNIYIPYDNTTKIYVIEDGKWMLTEKNCVIRNIIRDAQKRLIDYSNTLEKRGMYNTDEYRVLQRLKGEIGTSDRKIQEISQVINCILINNRERIKNYHGTIKSEK